MHSIKSCFCSSKPRYSARFKDHAFLAAETTFIVNEVEALHVLFEQLSHNGLIHKEEFKLALINSKSKNNLFADRLFELFDLKKNGVIEFEEFVRSLSIFHPNTADEDKIAFAFRLYDLNHTGYIERDELKEMVSATLSETDLYLPDDAVEAIVEKTLWEADLNGDGKIDLEEWKEMAAMNSSLIKNMTLPYLREITLAFPHFVMTTEVPDSELVFQTGTSSNKVV